VQYYDAHVHFLWKGSFDEVRQRWHVLSESGLKGMVGIIIGHCPENWERFIDLIPPQYQETLDKRFFEEGLGFQVPIAQQLDTIKVIPYLDCRFIEAQDSDLTRFYQAGFKGLKVLYIPDEDSEFGRVGWRKFYRISKINYQRLINRMVEQAFNFGWPIIFHADLRRYGDIVEEILQTNPGCPFIVPHFGFSRKIMAEFLERFDHCYTDFSSLLSFMQNNPRDYIDFIVTYQDRVLFGSDAFLGQPDLTADYLKFVTSFIGEESILTKIMSENYLRIHG